MSIYRLTIVIRRDGMSMKKVSLADLVSQAEQEGTTLAEVISRTWSPKQMEHAQAELAREMSANYENIQGFMSDVHIPSIDEILALEESDQFELGIGSDPLLSDAPPLE